MIVNLIYMVIAIVGKESVGKTRFAMAFLEKRYINMPTIDFHEYAFGVHILIDTPSFDKPQFLNVCKFNVDQYWVILDGNKNISSSDLECINLVRKFNKQMKLIVCFGQDNINEKLPQQPIYITSKKDIDQLREHYLADHFVYYDSKEQLITQNEDAQTEQGKYAPCQMHEQAKQDQLITQNEDAQTEQTFNTKEAFSTWILIGKENAGKSTLFNTLLGFNRALVSATPGTTKIGVQASFKGKIISDSAGVKSSNVDYVQNLIQNQALVIFVLDGTKHLTHTDKKLLGIIQSKGLICICVLNKSDHPDFNSGFSRSLSFLFKFMPIIEISALKRIGIGKLIAKCKQVSALKRISTKTLNKWLIDCKHLFHNIRVKYAVHVSLIPYEIVCFVSPMIEDKTKISNIRNVFVRYFKLEGVFVRIKVKAARSEKRALNAPEKIKAIREREKFKRARKI